MPSHPKSGHCLQNIYITETTHLQITYLSRFPYNCNFYLTCFSFKCHLSFPHFTNTKNSRQQQINITDLLNNFKAHVLLFQDTHNSTFATFLPIQVDFLFEAKLIQLDPNSIAQKNRLKQVDLQQLRYCIFLFLNHHTKIKYQLEFHIQKCQPYQVCQSQDTISLGKLSKFNYQTIKVQDYYYQFSLQNPKQLDYENYCTIINQITPQFHK
eukprot:TRINITY_DN85_c0_g1_i7.p1 TRINITY_DN85_c0_g1~~TRINITY_DN85_c0_g1_i7.p1  ORF type:complete len:211 (+),score=-11.19 TRINITY_DN85_c0_g1_i7:61-693(+)